MDSTPGRRAAPALAGLLLAAFMIMVSGCVEGRPGTPGGEYQPISGVVRGHVMTSYGTPVSRAEVFADNRMSYNTNLTTLTDESGYYEIQVPDIYTGSWRIGGYKTVQLGDVSVRMPLTDVTGGTFTASKGAVRNLEWRLSGSTIEGGHYGSDVWVYPMSESDEVPTSQVELTLTPVGALVDGSEGETLVRTPSIRRIGDVPLGTYLASARYLDGKDAIDLLIRVRDTGSPAPTVTTTFALSPFDTPQIEFEVTWP
ncbi:MAG: carboxypeptidase-like regulatory domain-containing protein [Terrimesophilobacter sp.]